MAEELVFSQRCTEALELLKPIVNQYRKESWSILLKAALKLALKCAYLVAAVPEYVAYALELSSNDIGKTHALKKYDLLAAFLGKCRT